MTGFIRAAICADTIEGFRVSGKARAASTLHIHQGGGSWLRWLGLWLIAAAALPTFAAAADAPQPTPATQSTPELGEVIVTAQHVHSTESRTPIAMDVISGEALRKQGLVTVADLNGYAQNVNVQENFNGVQLTIRGVTNSNGSTLDDPAISFMLDGIYIPRQTTPMYLGFYDINRIEVLRGPQGTLWGRNTTGGVVNVITNSPSEVAAVFRFGERRQLWRDERAVHAQRAGHRQLRVARGDLLRPPQYLSDQDAGRSLQP
jgi:outer membrane cobalamin receptor